MPLTDLTDCGAHGCIFAVLRPGTTWGGMRANGGCQHLKGGPAELRAMLRAAAARIASQRSELEAARAVVEASREAANAGDGLEVVPGVDQVRRVWRAAAGCGIALKNYDAVARVVE